MNVSRIYPSVFALVCLVASPLSYAIVPPPPKLPADAYFLIDANTGEVLVDHNGDLSLPPASLTKIMTSYVLAEEVQSGRASLDDPVTVDEESWAQNPLFEGSSLMWIEPGKPVTLGELERGIVISSGNDASVAAAKALAEALSGGKYRTRGARPLVTHDFFGYFAPAKRRCSIACTSVVGHVFCLDFDGGAERRLAGAK